MCGTMRYLIYFWAKENLGPDYLASKFRRLAAFLIPVQSVQKPQWQHPLAQPANTSTSTLSTKFPDSTTVSSVTESQNTTVGIIIPAVVHGESHSSEPAAGDLLVGSVHPDHQPQSEQSDGNVADNILSHAGRPLPNMLPLSAPFGMYPPFMHSGMFPQPPHPFMRPGMFPHPALSPLQAPNGNVMESLAEPKFLVGRDMRNGQGKRIGHAISKKLLVEGHPMKLSLYLDGKETVLNSRGGSRQRGIKKPVGTHVISGNPTSGSARAAVKHQIGQPVPLVDPLWVNRPSLPVGQFVTVLPGADIDSTTQLFPNTTAVPVKPDNQTAEYFTVSEAVNFVFNNTNITTTDTPRGTTSNTTVDFFNLRWLN